MSAAAILETHKAIESWEENDGKQACLDFIAPYALNAPTDAGARTTLYDVLYTLTSSTVSITGGSRLPVVSVVVFMQALLQRLPSSSSNMPQVESPSVATLGETIVDVIYSIDSTLEEHLSELKNSAKEENSTQEIAALLASQLQILGEDKKTVVSLIQCLVQRQVIRANVFREHLDFPLLCAAELMVDETTLTRKEVRFKTAAFYKQNKFNLLREQSEGYSKLITEVTALVGPAHNPATARPSENDTAVKHRAHLAWNKVISLIGHFELDPYRALDVILDMFSAQVVAHHAFFLELIKCTGWSRVSQELDDVSMKTDPEPSNKQSYSGLSFDEILLMAEGSDSGGGGVADSLDATPSDVPVCGQILTFKFVQSQASVSSSNESSHRAAGITRELYLATALLIREGHIKLSDIYPHLSPSDEDMSPIEKKALEASRKKLKAPPKVNALTQSTALEMSYSRSRAANPNEPAPKDADNKAATETPPQLPNQKLDLLLAMLSVGAVRPALQILAKFPWMVQAYTDVANLLLRMVEVSLSPISDALSFASRHPKYATSNSCVKSRWSPSGATIHGLRPVLTALAPMPISTHKEKFTYFYPDWAGWIPLCSSVDDISLVILPFLRLLGTQLHLDVKIIARLCKIGTSVISSINAKPVEEQEMSEDDDNRARAFWLDVLRLYLVPSLSLVRINSVVGQSLWSLLSLYSSEERWAIYDEWRKLSTGALTTRKSPELVIQASETARETKDILRRLTNNSQGNMFSVPISKLSHSNPTVVLQVTLTQGISYSNFPRFLADSMEYLTPLELDCLVWLVLKIFVDPNRDRVKDDGTSLMDWVQNLAQFTGKLLRNHLSMDPELILHYVIHRLQANESKELLILREVISNMTSITPLSDLNDKQVLALAGGPLYRAETISPTTRGSRSSALTSANLAGEKRLIDTLMRTKLAVPMLIVVAQTRANCVYLVSDREWHPKFMSSLFDECQAVLMQYVEFLTQALGAEYGALLPPLLDLCKTYGLEHPIAFHILRPMLAEPVMNFNVDVVIQLKQAKENDMKEKVRANLAARTAAVAASPSATTPSSSASPAPTSVALPAPSTPNMPAPTPIITQIWAPALLPLMDEAKEILPQRVQEVLGVAFFVTFWQMSMSDIGPPVSEYSELQRNLSEYSQSKPSSSLNSTELRVELDNRKLAGKISRELLVEAKTQFDNFEATRTRLQREKNEWFKASMSSSSFSTAELMAQMVRYCLHPRMLLSPTDAEYSGRLVKILHRLGTPGFSTLTCYDRLLGDHISAVVVSCSDAEVRNYGRFLRVILTDLTAWHSDENTYIKDSKTATGAYLPGFQKKWSNDKVVAQESIFTWKDFCGFLSKLHKKLTRAVVKCLTSNEYMHVRNVIKVLYEILPVYPHKGIYANAGSFIEQLVREIRDDPRDDIKTIAAGYHSRLLHVKAQWQRPELEPTAPTKSEVKAETVKTEPSNPILPAKPTTIQAPIPAKPSNSSGPKPAANGTSTPSIPLPPNPTLARGSPIPSGVSTPTNLPLLPKGLEAIASIPRPEVIKRTRNDKQDSPLPTLSSESVAMDLDQKEPKEHITRHIPATLPPKPMETSVRPSSSREPSPHSRRSEPRKDGTPQSPRGYRRDEIPGRVSQGMPPPIAPSSKLGAQELRASSTRHGGRGDNDGVALNGAHDPTKSPRRRSPSPSRPGTRNGSADSRSSATGGRARSDHGTTTDRDRHRDQTKERRASKREGSMRHERENERERIMTGDSSTSRRGDRTRDRDAPVDKDRPGRDRGRDKERDKDKERERDRDRIRDRSPDERHRRDSQSVRKDRDRELPTGPSSSRNSRRDDEKSRAEPPSGRPSNIDDNPHKRRRETEEEIIPAKRLRENGSLRDDPRDLKEQVRDTPRDTGRERGRDAPVGRDSRDSREHSRRGRGEPSGRDPNRETAPRDARDDNRGSVGRDSASSQDPRNNAPKESVRDRDSRRDSLVESPRDRDNVRDLRQKDRDGSARDDRGRREKEKDENTDKDRVRERRERNDDVDRSRADRPRRDRGDREVRDSGRDRSVERREVADHSERPENERPSRIANLEGREGKLAQNALRSLGVNNPPSGPRAMTSGEGGRPPPGGPRGSRANAPRQTPQDASRGPIHPVSLKDRIGALSSENGRGSRSDLAGPGGAGNSDPASEYLTGANSVNSSRIESGRDSPGRETRKRTLADRAGEGVPKPVNPPPVTSSVEPPPDKPQHPKRTRINRQGIFAGRMDKS